MLHDVQKNLKPFSQPASRQLLLFIFILVGVIHVSCGDQAELGGGAGKKNQQEIEPARENNNNPRENENKLSKKTATNQNEKKKTIKDRGLIPESIDALQKRAVSPCLVEIGKSFSEPGPFQVEHQIEQNLNLYIPKDLPPNCQVPIVHFSNGTGSTCKKNEVVPKHLASWGFISSCYESGETGSGEPCMQALGVLFERFKDQALLRVGSIGHSQGGAGAISCTYLAEKQWPNELRIATYAIQPAHGMNRPDYREEYKSIKSPVFIMSGSADFIVSDSWIESGYQALNTETYWYSAQGISHFNPENSAKNTAVAFFRWKLLDEQDGAEYIEHLTSSSQPWTLVSSKNTKQNLNSDLQISSSD